MNKIEIKGDVNDPNIVPMYEMPPLSIGIIKSPGEYKNKLVLRTAAITHLEVINLSNPGKNRCWNDYCDLLVKLLPGARIIIEL